MTASVAAAFFASGGWNAGTPVAIASVPVRATAPAANARSRRRTVTAWKLSPTWLATAASSYGVALAEDDDPERADGDHQQGRARGTGRSGAAKRLPASRRPRRLPIVIRAIATTPRIDPVVEEGRERPR